MSPLIAFFLFFSISLASCETDVLWGKPVGEIAASVAGGDLSFLDRVPRSKYGEALRAGRAVPWILGMKLEDAGDPGRALEMYAVGADAALPKPDEPDYAVAVLGRLKCLRALARISSGTERLDALDRLKETLSDGETAGLPEIVALATESALAELVDARNATLAELGRPGEIPGGPEAWLDSRPFTADILRAGTSLPDSTLDSRARSSFAWRAAVFARDYQRSWLLAEAHVGTYGWPSGRNPLSDLGKSATYGAPDALAASALFEKAAATLSEADRYVTLFYAARLAYRSSPGAGGETPDARGDRLMTLARDSAVAPRDRDGATWYLLDSASRRGMDALIGGIAREAENWADPLWFSDILDGATASLVAAKDWNRLGRLRDALAGRGGSELAARLGYLAARSGILKGDAARVELERIRNDLSAPTYYRILSADLLGAPFSTPADFASSLAGTRRAVDSAAETEILDALLEWHSPEAVWPLVRELGFAPPPADSARIAETLSGAGYPSDALRLTVTALSAEGREASLTDLFGAYPRPWAEETRAAAGDSGLSELLLYAMVRSESFFDPKIRSVAGASGLTQLMDTTAADMARKKKLAEYDVLDPATNLDLGAAYLGELVTRLDGHVIDAVFSYNAGINRVRQWRRAFGSGDDDLFLESVPYAETREYGRKVLVAAVFYGYLYYRESADRTVRLILDKQGR